MDEVINWFRIASKEEIGFLLLGIGIVFNIIGIVFKKGCVSFSLGGLLIIIGLFLIFSTC